MRLIKDRQHFLSNNGGSTIQQGNSSNATSSKPGAQQESTPVAQPNPLPLPVTPAENKEPQKKENDIYKESVEGSIQPSP